MLDGYYYGGQNGRVWAILYLLGYISEKRPTLTVTLAGPGEKTNIDCTLLTVVAQLFLSRSSISV